MTDKKHLEQRYGLDMSMPEAIGRFAKAAKEEAESDKSTDLIPEGQIELVLFGKVQIRKVLHENEWWFSVVDVVGALTDSPSPRRYWSDMKRQLTAKEGFSELYENIVQLKMPASDGKEYETDAATTETLLRIIQSIPSPKAEPFKRWLAKVGYERIQETQDPEIAIKRAILSYQIQGRSDDWIEKRIRSVVVRKELTALWKKAGVEEGKEYAVLTNVISMNTFGISIDGHKRVKSLQGRHSLRDHMTDLELIFTMLGEKSTTEIAQQRKAKGFHQNFQAASAGGKIAGGARAALEDQTGVEVVSRSNFLGV